MIPWLTCFFILITFLYEILLILWGNSILITLEFKGFTSHCVLLNRGNCGQHQTVNIHFDISERTRTSHRHDQLLHFAVHRDASSSAQTAQGCVLFLQCAANCSPCWSDAGCVDSSQAGNLRGPGDYKCDVVASGHQIVTETAVAWHTALDSGLRSLSSSPSWVSRDMPLRKTLCFHNVSLRAGV